MVVVVVVVMRVMMVVITWDRAQVTFKGGAERVGTFWNVERRHINVLLSYITWDPLGTAALTESRIFSHAGSGWVGTACWHGTKIMLSMMWLWVAGLSYGGGLGSRHILDRMFSAVIIEGSKDWYVKLRMSKCTPKQMRIHSFRLFPLQVHYRPNSARILCRSFTPQPHKQAKDLPKVLTWSLDSNLLFFGRKAPNLPLCHHALTCPLVYLLISLTALPASKFSQIHYKPLLFLTTKTIDHNYSKV